MNNTSKLLIASLVATLMTACGGGGNTTPPAPPQQSTSTLTQAQHDALTQQFIAEASVESVPMTLVKTDTQQPGYIVTKDASGNLVAYYIDGWTPGSSVASYLLNGTDGQPNYSGLTDNLNGTYSIYIPNGYSTTTCNDLGLDCTTTTTDTSYTLVFEVAQPTSKDLQKVAAFQQSYQIEASAQKIQEKFGLSLERSTQVAKLAIQAKNTPNMKEGDYDSLSQQLLGVPLKKLDAAVVQHAKGDDSMTNELIDQAAATNGIGSEQARNLLNSLTGSLN